MLSEKQVEAVEQTAAELNRRRAQQPAGAQPPAQSEDDNPDRVWAKENLRWRDGFPLLDIANAMRVLDRHEDYKGRFRYNDDVDKVLDKGSIMLDWRVLEVCADIQERFLPDISETAVRAALTVNGNRNCLKN
jgi:hypothetical protein